MIGNDTNHHGVRQSDYQINALTIKIKENCDEILKLQLSKLTVWVEYATKLTTLHSVDV
jgi:hypothetical protein